MTEPSFAFYLEIAQAPNPPQRLEISGPRVLIGSGAHCDVRLVEGGIGREHVALELEGAQVVAIALAKGDPYTVAPLRSGVPFVRTTIGSGETIVVGSTSIRVQARAVGTESTKSGRDRLSTMLCAAAVLMLPALVYASVRETPEPRIGPAPREVTALFDAQPAACAVGDADRAGALGQKLKARAELERERRPYAVADGIRAVGSFAQAGACFRVAGRTDEAATMEVTAKTLREKVEEDYHVHRVRLEHALDVNDEATAANEVEILRRLTGARSGAYTDWLNVVQRHLEANNRQKRKEQRS